jgi:hypothetical protein
MCQPERALTLERRTHHHHSIALKYCIKISWTMRMWKEEQREFFVWGGRSSIEV